MRNKMNESTFYIACVICTIIIGREYTKRVIYDLPGPHMSSMILALITAVLVWKGLQMTEKKYRTPLNVLVNALLPIQAHFVLMAFLNTTSNLKWIAISIIIGSIGIALYVINVHRGTDEAVKEKSKEKIKENCLLVSRTVLSLCLVIPLLTSMYIDTSLIPERKQDSYSGVTWSEEATLSSNVEILKTLKEEEWSTLSREEKNLQIETIKMVECNFLGINPDEVEIKIEELGRGTLGSYDHTRRCIKLDVDLYNRGPGREVLDTLLHEFYHAYEHRMVSLYKTIEEEYPEYSSLLIFSDSENWKKDFSNYIDANKDYEGYSEQNAEADARVYAANSVKEYFDAIDKYISYEG